MTAPAPPPGPGPAPAVAGDLAQLEAKVQSTRAVLARLLKEVVAAEARLSDSPAARLLEANEQLVLAALHDRSEAVTAAQALTEAVQAAEHDPLTKLPNRVLLRDRLVQAIASARRHGRLLALLFIDLDGFKPVNDRFGHVVGDELLQAVATRLLAGVRDADTVSRHGGDEFLVLLDEVAQAADAGRVAAKLAEAVAAPLTVSGHAVGLSASIGVSLYPQDGEEADVLIERADAAMFRAKRRGPGRVAFHGEPARDMVVEAAAREPTVDEAARRMAELREANEQLLLAALSARELQDAAARAQQRQSEFLGLVAQELGTPLTPIRLATAMLGRVRSDEPLLPRARSIIDQQVVHMTRLVEAVQAVSKAESAALSLARRPLDLRLLLQTAAAAVRPAMTVRQQQFSLELPPQPLWVSGEAARMLQVLQVLLDNASKYTPDRGRIALAAERGGELATVTVSDDGIGISTQALPEVFQPFAQDIHAIGYNGVGAGVGLAVARALVQAHGGTLEAASGGIDRGSRFTMRLPALAGPEAAA